jgi:hypothetical protein
MERPHGLEVLCAQLTAASSRIVGLAKARLLIKEREPKQGDEYRIRRRMKGEIGWAGER